MEKKTPGLDKLCISRVCRNGPDGLVFKTGKPPFLALIETFEKRSILFKVKEDENFNHRRPAGSALGVNALSISRIKI